jgi:tRNA A37 threonylcarbamoyltransferase TsaD
MGRPKGSLNKKSPYEKLPEEWKNAAMAMSYEALDEAIANIAKNEDDNQKAKADDVDLASLREQVKDVASPYTEATKSNKLKTQYLIEAQGARGKRAKTTPEAVPPVVVKST